MLASLCQAHYRSLVRLAALLTADVLMAEEIAADALAALINSASGSGAPDRVQFVLRRHVLISARRVTRNHQTRRAGRPAPGRRAASQPDPVLQALRDLPDDQREVLVLRHYLDLSERETAAVMGASLRTVRRSLADLPAGLTGS